MDLAEDLAFFVGEVVGIEVGSRPACTAACCLDCGCLSTGGVLVAVVFGGLSFSRRRFLFVALFFFVVPFFIIQCP